MSDLKPCRYCEGRGMRATRPPESELYTCDHCKGSGRAEPEWRKQQLEDACQLDAQGQRALELLRESPLSLQPIARAEWEQKRRALLKEGEG